MLDLSVGDESGDGSLYGTESNRKRFFIKSNLTTWIRVNHVKQRLFYSAI